ncbi:hypothetical protein L1027_25395, partial [Escherichia coli]
SDEISYQPSVVSQEMSFTDNWSDEEFIRQIKELIGNEGDIHVTCNHSEGEQVTETHVHAESSLVSP